MYKVMKIVGVGLIAVSACASAYMLYKEVKRIKKEIDEERASDAPVDEDTGDKVVVFDPSVRQAKKGLDSRRDYHKIEAVGDKLPSIDSILASEDWEDPEDYIQIENTEKVEEGIMRRDGNRTSDWINYMNSELCVCVDAQDRLLLGQLFSIAVNLDGRDERIIGSIQDERNNFFGTGGEYSDMFTHKATMAEVILYFAKKMAYETDNEPGIYVEQLLINAYNDCDQEYTALFKRTHEVLVDAYERNGLVGLFALDYKVIDHEEFSLLQQYNTWLSNWSEEVNERYPYHPEEDSDNEDDYPF